MRQLRPTLARLRALFSRRRTEQHMSAELQAHIEMLTDRHVAEGMSRGDARHAALREFGGVEQIKERCRDERKRGWLWLDTTARDVRFAGRGLRKNPLLTSAVVSSLALCLGANVAIFSLLYGLVLRPLPFDEPGRLVEVYNEAPKVGIPKLFSNVGQYVDFKANAPAFASMALWRLDDFTLGEADGPVRIAGAVATADLFEVLGIHPVAGHFFRPGNQVPGADNVAVLTESFWSTHFQRDPGIVGRSLLLDGKSVEIVGVAPRVVEALDPRAKLIRPFAWPPTVTPARRGWSPHLYGRLRAGATLAAARAQVTALEQHYAEGDARAREFFERIGKIVRVDSLRLQRAAPVARSLYLLQGAVALLLAIGCVNIANLLLARSNQRRPEFMIRSALGASRATLARQLLVETALLTLLGSALGLALAWGALGAVNHFATQLLPYARPFSVDGKVLAWAAMLAAAVTAFIGLLPVLRMLRDDSHLPTHGRAASANRHMRTTGNVLVVAQVAFALVLLILAGLLIRSFENAVAVAPGFDPRDVIAARIGVPANKEKSFSTRLDAALREIPGASAALANSTPFVLVGGFSMPLEALTLRDVRAGKTESQPSVYVCGVSPTYRDVMRIPLREGRWLDASDVEQGRAVVVDERFVRRFFPAGNALGQHLVLNRGAPSREEEWLEIVGIVGDVRHNGVDDASGQPFLYQPYSQVRFYGTLSVFLRTTRPVADIAAVFRNAVAGLDPTLPVVEIRPMPAIIGDSFDHRRGVMLLLAAFAAIALLLSAVGIYGVLAYDVSQRTREIGIRTAIGATRWQIGRMIMRQTMAKVAVGLALGIGSGIAASRYISALLFEIQPIDGRVYAATTFVLAAIALLASWLPARRAMSINPVEALRAE